MGKAVRIVGDEQAHWDMRRLETLRKIHGGITTYGMANNGNWFGIAAVVADRLVRHRAPH